MFARRHVILALIVVCCNMGATFRTTNFVVQAPTDQIARRIGQLAEYYRRERAKDWLGFEMPAWRQPCPLQVRITMGGPSGATTFNFGRDDYGRGMVLGRRMQIQGPLNRLEASVLPHEITHTVFAHHFKQPVPRWADEGGSVLSEDDVERVRHDKMTRSILNSAQEIRLRTLLRLTEYPRGKVMHLYAQGYSLTNYLVNHRGGRRKFLNFVATGMRNRNNNWDNAAWTYYKHRSVEDLEGAWLKHLRDTKGQDHVLIARRARQGKSRTAPATIVRLTVPSSTPTTFKPATVIRGQSPTTKLDRAGSRSVSAPGRPRYLPDYPPNSAWQAPRKTDPPIQIQSAEPVRLGPPQFGALPSGPVIRPPLSPVGFPR